MILSHFRYIAIALIAALLCPAALPAQEAATAPRLVIPATDEGLPGAGPIRRAEWFQNVWRNRRSTFARGAETDREAVVFLGDSITQGWNDDFRGDFPGVKVANRGISGDTTRGMLIRLHEDVLDLDPAAVVMLMGTNDLEENAEPETIAGNVELILGELKKHDPEMPIVICQVFPSSASKKRSAEKITELNRRVSEIAKDHPQATVVDTWTLFADADGDAKKEEFPDLLHPNEQGYAKWKKAIWPIFATLGFIETEVEPYELEPGFESLFNGVDLTGWGYRPTTPQMLKSRERWQQRDPAAPAWPIVSEPVNFDGRQRTPDGRYLARSGRLIVTTPTEGRKIQQLWTTREFSGDFQLVLEFRATPNADSGVFLRGPQLQCRDYHLAGPYKDLESYRPGEWNELVVTAKGSVARCSCNGEVIEEAFKIPESGPIGLEGDRGQVEYRRIRIKALP